MNGDQDGTAADWAMSATDDAKRTMEERIQKLKNEISILRSGLRQLILLLYRTDKITDTEKAALFTWLSEEKS